MDSHTWGLLTSVLKLCPLFPREYSDIWKTARFSLASVSAPAIPHLPNLDVVLQNAEGLGV